MEIQVLRALGFGNPVCVPHVQLVSGEHVLSQMIRDRAPLSVKHGSMRWMNDLALISSLYELSHAFLLSLSKACPRIAVRPLISPCSVEKPCRGNPSNTTQ